MAATGDTGASVMEPTPSELTDLQQEFDRLGLGTPGDRERYRARLLPPAAPTNVVFVPMLSNNTDFPR